MSNYVIPLYHLYQNGSDTFNLTLFGQVTTLSTKSHGTSWTLPRRSSIFNHIFSPPQKASKFTLFVARTLSSQSAVIAHVRDCPSLKGTILNGTVCRSSLFSRVFPSPSSTVICLYFKRELSPSPFPFSVSSVVDVLNILTIFMNNLWSITIKFTVLLYHMLCLV